MLPRRGPGPVELSPATSWGERPALHAPWGWRSEAWRSIAAMSRRSWTWAWEGAPKSPLCSPVWGLRLETETDKVHTVGPKDPWSFTGGAPDTDTAHQVAFLPNTLNVSQVQETSGKSSPGNGQVCSPQTRSSPAGPCAAPTGHPPPWATPHHGPPPGVLPLASSSRPGSCRAPQGETRRGGKGGRR